MSLLVPVAPTGALGTVASLPAPATRHVASPITRVASPITRPARPAAPTKFLGTLIVPRLKLRAPIYSGIADSVFDMGLGHWPGTAMPGKKGNSVIGGHRTGAMMPFLNIDKMRKGDRIIAKIGRKSFTYKVSKVAIEKPTNMSIVRQTKDSRITLFTCHPPHSIKLRYVVTAVLIN